MAIDIKEFTNLLKTNHNLILTGAPGTGKTYLAKRIAAKMIMGKDYSPCMEQNPDFTSRVGFVQFHPSYDYTDFVEGLRPITAQEQGKTSISFQLKNGIFKEFCGRAYNVTKKMVEEYVNNNIGNYEERIKSTILTTIVSDQLRSYVKTNKEIEYYKDNERNFYIELFENKKIQASNQNGTELNIDNIINLFIKNETIHNFFKSENNITSKYNYRSICLKLNKDGIKDQLAQQYKQFVEDVIRRICETLYYEFPNGNNNDPNDLKSQIQDEVKDEVKEQVKNSIHVFIIDEINRGDISKIFGESFFSIDPGYRGIKGRVATQYQNMITDNDGPFKDGFFVPENVYIIGTMNDIDRSVESMDFAMRRRFAWREITAEDSISMLDDKNAWGKGPNGKWRKPKDELLDDIKERMNSLNDCIIDNNYLGGDRIGLSKAYQIGASYFLKYNTQNELAPFQELWDYHIKGLLYEYLRGTTNVECKIASLCKSCCPNHQESTQNNIIDELTKQLENNHNLILTGAPGTGKTYLAKRIADNLISGNSSSQDKERDSDSSSIVGFVQFHPSYDYTDFVEGLRPIINGESSNGFERRDGIFKRFCKDALQENDNGQKPKCVFIIDEINRGDISKIFGELFFSIDPGYRGIKGRVATQYQNLIADQNDPFTNGFFVPENVYIIGTMNDIDRSVESMDFAMRRRFAWKEITAKDSQSMLDDQNAWANGKPGKNIIKEIKYRMNNLNDCIIDKNYSGGDRIGLSKAYQIGASYFIKYEHYNNNFNKLWKNHIEGLLYEYLRGTTNIDIKIGRLKEAYDKKQSTSQTA